jgi:hypothetical protein
VSHPSLGAPPPDPTAGFPAAGARIQVEADALAARALRIAMDADRSIEERYAEAGLRHLLRDARLLAERIARALATGEADTMHEYAEWTAVVYRRRQTPLDDIVGLCEGLRSALPAILAPAEMAAASDAIDAAVAVYRWHRRIAGDARRKNAFLQFIYKGG